MSRPNNLVVNFLNELSSQDFRDAFESLRNLVEYLEDKNDPEPSELNIVEAAYEFIEKVKILESTLRNHVRSSDQLGSKLQKLYDNNKTRSLFE
jgi:hypothetical protein